MFQHTYAALVMLNPNFLATGVDVQLVPSDSLEEWCLAPITIDLAV